MAGKNKGVEKYALDHERENTVTNSNHIQYGFCLYGKGWLILMSLRNLWPRRFGVFVGHSKEQLKSTIHMGTSCPPAPINKKEYISDIGKILVKKNGKKKYYTPKEVKKAHKETQWYNVLDFSCWAMSVFSAHSDFNKYHQETGEICDYAEMKTEMLSGLSVLPTSDWMDIPDLDIDASWLDFGNAFEGIFEGIGEFVGGIFHSL